MIIDSGVGGLNVAKAFKKNGVKGNFLYVADQKNMPYGLKSKRELLIIVSDLINNLKKSYKFNDVIVACNTLCVTVYKELSDIFKDLTFYSIAHSALNNINAEFDSVCVLSTLTTYKSNFFRGQTSKSNIIIPVDGLAEAIESRRSEQELETIITKAFKTYSSAKNYKKIYLCCTHYDYAKKTIQNQVNNSVVVVDPSNYFALELKKKLPISKDFQMKTITTSKCRGILDYWSQELGLRVEKDSKDNVGGL